MLKVGGASMRATHAVGMAKSLYLRNSWLFRNVRGC
jgi:hypothetical protein